jgi:molecular chaperone GrpE
MADGERPDAQQPIGQAGSDRAPDAAEPEDESPLDEVESLRGKVDAYLDLAQRTQADFANYKKRIEREREQDSEIARANLTRSLLSVFDDFDRAVSVAPPATEGTWANGVLLIHRKLQQWLEAQQIKRVEQVGEQFDPARHEAVAYEERPGFAEGQVASVLQAGYVMGDRVLRPAQVTVARGGATAAGTTTQSDEHTTTLHGGGD